jgi:hypothetical protein
VVVNTVLVRWALYGGWVYIPPFRNALAKTKTISVSPRVRDRLLIYGL